MNLNVSEVTLPANRKQFVTLAHGAGGRAMQQLISEHIAKIVDKEFFPLHDSSVFEAAGKLAFCTDSYVVSPLFFSGGNIGKLAVFGTCNDLAMSGARPKYLSCALVIEEGFSLHLLEDILQEIQAAAKTVDAKIITGDTKVVPKGQADGLYINTSGIGFVESKKALGPSHIRAGDAILLSGDLGRHGLAIFNARQANSLHTLMGDIESDCAPLWPAVEPLLQSGCQLSCLRDLTRGGLSAALWEIAQSSGQGMLLWDENIPYSPAVKGAAELLGFDPFSMANEGRLVAFVRPESAQQALEAMRRVPVSQGACLIGKVTEDKNIVVENAFGGLRILTPPFGETLPRIC